MDHTLGALRAEIEQNTKRDTPERYLHHAQKLYELAVQADCPEESLRYLQLANGRLNVARDLELNQSDGANPRLELERLRKRLHLEADIACLGIQQTAARKLSPGTPNYTLAA